MDRQGRSRCSRCGKFMPRNDPRWKCIKCRTRDYPPEEQDKIIAEYHMPRIIHDIRAHMSPDSTWQQFADYYANLMPIYDPNAPKYAKQIKGVWLPTPTKNNCSASGGMTSNTTGYASPHGSCVSKPSLTLGRTKNER